MSQKIRVGIVGYGNVGKGVELALEQTDDMELVAIFTRREPSSLDVDNPDIAVLDVSKAKDFIDRIDVMILCGGSATDLVKQGPYFAKNYNTVDSFDTHAKIPKYFESMDEAATIGKNTSLISIGWDPGLFSLNRLMTEAILPRGEGHTFWGPGISLGHSDAVRRVEGVKDAVQYTIPIDVAIDKVREGDGTGLTNAQKHLRRCFVVAEEDADTEKIEQDIKAMPNYFADYKTEVIFIDEEELEREHAGSPHGGIVVHSGQTGKRKENTSVIEYSLKLGSNAEFTASVMVAYARATYRLNKEGYIGAKTIFDIAPAYLSPKSPQQLREQIL